MNTVEYITDKKGKKNKIVLPLKEYQLMLEKIEDLEDALEADKILNDPQVKYHTLDEFIKQVKAK